MNWLLGVIAVLLFLDLLLRVVYVRLILRIFEAAPPFSPPTLPPHPTAEMIEFPTRNGLVLRGSLYCQPERASRGLILFCPEMDCSHWSAMSYCSGLIDNGFDVMSFDFRGQGESDCQPDYIPNHWPTMFEVEDVRAALDFIQSRDDLRELPLGVMGISRGSAPALIGAAERPNVGAVFCEGAYSTDSLMLHFMMRWATLYIPGWAFNLVPKWHYQITSKLVRWTSSILRRRRYVVLEKWLPRLKDRPVLLVSGDRDNYVHSDVTRELKRRIKSSSTTIWHVPQAKHNQARATAGAEYDRRLTDFFGQLQAPFTAT
ncbi:MAG: alpha/beta fold hydrolase [Candidatus Saccharimonas sp.]|nr:alpha/beta fold hydrolase [Planctomycetaceae bacterium]